MDILVLSDSHGAVAPMIRAVELTAPNLIIHLGDCWRDGERLHTYFPDIPLEQVPGNCDFRPTEPAERLLGMAPRGSTGAIRPGTGRSDKHPSAGRPSGSGR